MRIKDVIKYYEKNHPRYLQEDWDNTNTIVGNVDNEVKNILVTLEITNESIEYAITNHCNLIISHHPLIFPSIKNIVSENFKGNKLIKAIKNDITIYASHTASDVSGFNEYIFKKIGYESEGKIVEIDYGYGYGSYITKKTSLDEIVKNIKNNLDIENIIVYGDKTEFDRLGLVTGSGMSFLKEVLDKDIDIFITGDITHHDYMDSIEQGLALIDITHQGSEKLFCEYVKEELEKNEKFNDINILTYYNEDKYLPKFV